MKTNKPKAQKKDARKAAKKEFETSLSSKIFEAVKHFGQDAEKFAKDIELVSKFLAKKLSKKFEEAKADAVTKVGDVASKPTVKEPIAAVKKSAVKVSKTAKKAVETAVKKAKPVVNSVKVAAIGTEEKAAQVIAKPIKKAVDNATESLKPVIQQATETIDKKVKPALKKAVATKDKSTPVGATRKNAVSKPKESPKPKTDVNN
jgi:predicted house-cleaning noncanonical NTP pyrophosphatase (MazG superfamily)